MTARGTIYPELGAELKSSEMVVPLSIGPLDTFERLVADQSVWIIDLLKFIQFTPDSNRYGTMDITIDDILAEHDKEGYLVAVSDGSVRHMHQMSFGWVLATAKGTHLATSFGGCDGRGSSLRAEAVGMLSISTFIALMAKHRNREDIKIVYVSDNLELIRRSKEHSNYTSPYPNNTLSAEYDITKQIYIMNKTYMINATFQHVYGHQAQDREEKCQSKQH